jgi:hypothetical protein
MIALSRYRSFFVAGSIFLILFQIVVVGLGLSGGLEGRADFRSFYASGYLMRSGHADQLYDYNRTAATEMEVIGNEGASLPSIHPAYEALLFAVLANFTYKKAYWLFFFLNIAVLIGTIRLLQPAPDWMSEVYAGLPTLVAAGFLPVGICLIQGQDSILFFLLIVSAYLLQKSNRDLAAGTVLALGMFRFQLVIPLIVCLFFARRWKLIGGFAITCMGVAAISIAVTEPASWTAYPRHLFEMNSGLQTASAKLAHAIYPEKMPNFRGLIYLLLGPRVPAILPQILTAVFSVLIFAWAIIKRLPFELLVVVAVLVSYHGLIHDSVLLLLPLLVCDISSSRVSIKRLFTCILLLTSPVLAFVLNLPFAVLCPVYVAFLAVMAEGKSPVHHGRRVDITVAMRCQ